MGHLRHAGRIGRERARRRVVRQPRERRGQPAGGGPAGDGVRGRAQPGGAGLERGPGARADRRRHARRTGDVLYGPLSRPAAPERLQRRERAVPRLRSAGARGRLRSARPVRELLRLGRVSIAAAARHPAGPRRGRRYRAVAAEPGRPERGRLGSLDAQHRRDARDGGRSVTGRHRRHLRVRRDALRREGRTGVADQGGDRADGGRSQRGRLPGGVRRTAAVARSLAEPPLHSGEGAGLGRRGRDARGRLGRLRDRAARRAAGAE